MNSILTMQYVKRNLSRFSKGCTQVSSVVICNDAAFLLLISLLCGVTSSLLKVANYQLRQFFAVADCIAGVILLRTIILSGRSVDNITSFTPYSMNKTTSVTKRNDTPIEPYYIIKERNSNNIKKDKKWT